MKNKITGLALLILRPTWALAQSSKDEQALLQLSKNKRQWMTNKNVEKQEDWKMLALIFSPVRDTHQIEK